MVVAMLAADLQLRNNVVTLSLIARQNECERIRQETQALVVCNTEPHICDNCRQEMRNVQYWIEQRDLVDKVYHEFLSNSLKVVLNDGDSQESEGSDSGDAAK